ncbi:MFS multidrug-resistance DHA1 sub-family [Gloeophyllum trabeum ATCC 11539]|uniref:MFS multidrug-resistance DHA1 sub-family n=1 Tax=Gloeophyllum trabeum (strain ATCC 11539 / FP-39264 / Madison 617) TaxID=670483 RepID=S7S1D0_GLOTA|nr:MFS multidrug-resistance DHA1 sub-family [Gloeophyllum trabeum ATCC 11539]EPQ61255.1 MFS multidrug-resistance DHA1 sub-family [Gloeophyllum trabeum ATCC 11539]
MAVPSRRSGLVPRDEDPGIAEEQVPKPAVTQLPWLQLSIVYWVQLSEPMTGYVLFPIINQMILEYGLTNGDEKEVGYYAGAIMSAFYVTETLFVFFWGRLSDRLGRRPVVLTGILGSGVTMVMFGLMRTFVGLLLSRGLSGAVNGNIGVLKSMIAEMTDETNQARAWSLAPVVFASGATLAPIIGGGLAHPAERFSRLFGSWDFFKAYPYFLPCFVASIFPFSAFVVSALFLKETLPTRDHPRKAAANTSGSSEPDSDQAEPSASTPLLQKSDKPKPPPIRSILTTRVQIAILNYGTISLLSIMYSFMQPLFLSTPLGKGGLGLSSAAIGWILGACGLWNGLFQGLFFPALHRRLGTKKLFMISVCTYIPLFVLWPLMTILSSRTGFITLVVKLLLASSRGCSHIFITSAAPTRSSLGATTGLGQTVASFMRVVGPALSASLFAVSLQRDLFGGFLVYLILIILALGTIAGGTLLPTVMKKASEEAEEVE